MIPFLDLRAQYAGIKQELAEVVMAVLGSGTYALGPEVERFEEEFAAYHGVAHGVALNSGTSALHLALLASGVGAGDEVITVSMTFIATAAAISYTGATPVFVDIDPDTLTMDVSKIEERVTPRTKAIIPVHLYGQAAEMDRIMEAAKRYGLVVIEDAAQAHGAEYRGVRVGGMGDLSAFSFYPGKNLGACGEGGMVLTNSAAHANAIRRLRDWGQAAKYHHDVLGYNYRMDAIQGAVLRVKLRHLDKWTRLRRDHAAHYATLLGEAGVRVTTEAPDRKHVYHIYSVFDARRDALRQALQDAGVQTGIHYPIPVHLQKPYMQGGAVYQLPATEAVANEQLSLPMFPELTSDMVARVSEAVCNWYSERARDRVTDDG